MKTQSEAVFLEWAATKGLHLDPQYPHSAVLAYAGTGGESRFWAVPFEPERRPYFIACLLKLLGEWQSCFVWRHMGSWPSSADPDRVNDAVEWHILAGLGLPLGTADIVEFSRAEFDKLVTLVFSTTIFGWSVNEDLYIVPDHANAYLQTDHHDVIHAVCRDAERIDDWIKQMADAGFNLPDDIPDETFKVPSWLQKNLNSEF